MSSKMEDILGPIDRERRIPGTFSVEGREYRYLGCKVDEDVAALFKTIVRKIDPPIAKSGGVGIEGCKIILPSGDCYFAVSYKGDVPGWREQIEKGADALDVPVAQLLGDKLLLGDGSEVSLSDCQVQFD
jgi:hypothetical protein